MAKKDKAPVEEPKKKKGKAPEPEKKGKEKPSKKADSKPAKSKKSKDDDDEFSNPSSGSGFTIQGDDHLGRLFLVKPTGVEKDVKTEYGVTDAIRADVVMFDKKGRVEEEESDILVFPKVLQSQLRPAISKGGRILGRLGQGTAKAKQDPPWRLDDPTDEDKKIARSYLKSNPF